MEFLKIMRVTYQSDLQVDSVGNIYVLDTW